MDHESMRNALDRAIEMFKPEQCNMCGNPSQEGFGEFIDLVFYHKIVKVWECADCISSEETCV